MGTDKYLHFIVGAVSCAWYTKELGTKGMFFSILFIAVGKELYDWWSYGGAGINEAALDILSTMIVPAITLIVVGCNNSTDSI